MLITSPVGASSCRRPCLADVSDDPGVDVNQHHGNHELRVHAHHAELVHGFATRIRERKQVSGGSRAPLPVPIADQRPVVRSAGDYTRPWFAWANSLFGSLILKIANENPSIIFA